MNHDVVSRSLALSIASSLLALFLAPAVSAQVCGSEVVLQYLDAGTSSPLLRTPRGAPVVGGDFAFRVEGGAPLEVGFLIFNGAENPFFDPTFQATLYPQVPALVRLFFTNAAGSSPLLFDTPEIFDDLCGEQATFQAGVGDAGAPGGFAITNAVRIRVGAGTEPLFEPLPEPGGNPTDVALGDMNGDALPDLVMPNSNGASAIGSVRVRLGSPSGGFGAAATTSLGGGAFDPSSVAVADISGDGELDALVTNRGSDNVSLLFGNGAGGFLASASFAAGDGPSSSTVSDLDLDGFLDVVVANGTDSAVSVLRGNGSGFLSFAVPHFVGSGTGGSGPTDVEAGDLDEDGDPDLVVAVSLGNLVSSLLGNGDATFGAPILHATAGRPWFLELEDFDGDTLLDVAVTSRLFRDISVRSGNGDGTFGAELRIPSGRAPRDIVSADLDGDSQVDLLAVNSESDDLTVLHGNGDGTFAVERVGVFHFPNALVLVDSDFDGALDVVVASPNSTFSSSLGHTTTLLGNGDGTFRGASRYSVGSGMTGVALADFDDDGWNDLVTADPTSDQLFVLLSDAAGGFAPPAPLLAGVGPSSIVVADLDGDLEDDLVVLASFTDQLRVLLGNGDGTFGLETLAANLTNNPGGYTVADFDGDAVPDIAASDRTLDEVSVFLGNGDATFGAPTTFSVVDSPRDLIGAYLDGDAVLDLVVRAQPLAVLLGNGDGSFVALPPVITSVSAMTLGDFDEDGELDLLASRSVTGANIFFYAGNGDGTFGVGNGVATSGIVRPVAADANDDGNLDVLGLATGSDALVVIPGNGDGTFGVPAAHPAGFTLADIAVGDLDGDGVVDVAVADDLFEGRLSVLWNRLGE